MRIPDIVAIAGITAIIGGSSWINTARASVIVHVIQNDPTANNASIVPSSTLPSADFLSPDIDFHINNSLSTSLATFLNNPTFTNQQNGFDPTSLANNVFLEITGQTFLNSGTNAFVVGHDDGVVLTFSDPSIGTVVNAPGGTAFVNTPFDVNAPASGLYDFDLKYSECCGGAADLVFKINGEPVGSTVPEPGSLTLLLFGLAGLTTLRRQFSRT
jgi:hypothetical protein